MGGMLPTGKVRITKRAAELTRATVPVGVVSGVMMSFVPVSFVEGDVSVVVGLGYVAVEDLPLVNHPQPVAVKTTTSKQGSILIIP